MNQHCHFFMTSCMNKAKWKKPFWTSQGRKAGKVRYKGAGLRGLTMTNIAVEVALVPPGRGYMPVAFFCHFIFLREWKPFNESPSLPLRTSSPPTGLSLPSLVQIRPAFIACVYFLWIKFNLNDQELRTVLLSKKSDFSKTKRRNDQLACGISFWIFNDWSFSFCFGECAVVRLRRKGISCKPDSQDGELFPQQNHIHR